MSMLTIKKNQEDTKLTVSVIGRVDTLTSPQFEDEVSSSLDGVTELVLNFAQTEYVSSAGLRVIVAMQKRAVAGGSLVFRGVVPEVMEVFQMTGFEKILTFE